MASEFDLIVLGVGGIGSAALYAAANQGLRVLGIEQFGYAHDRGSSHGQTRIIRTAYFEHPDYVPLAQQSWQKWEAIQSQCDQTIIRRTGLIQIGPPDSTIVQGVLTSASRYGLTVAQMSASEIEARWPVMNIPDGHLGVFEEQAGYLRVERCISHMIALARERGAEFLANRKVDDFRVADNGQVAIRAAGQEFFGRRAVLTAGPWMGPFVADLGIELKVLRKPQFWFQLDRPDVHEAWGMCCFLFDTPEGVFYGFPAIESMGVKVAEHTGGDLVVNPSEVDRLLRPADLNRVQEFIGAHFRFTRLRMTHHSVCMYTKSVDEHFIVDRHPRWPNVAFVCGLSGHGFKFAPVLGEHVVGLVTDQPNPLCRFLGLERFESHGKSL